MKSYLHQYIDNIATISYVAGGNREIFEQMYQDFQHTAYNLSTHTLEDSSKNKYMTNQTIGFLIMIMLMSAGNMSEIILLEKENRTYFRLLSTPINARKYILSNMIVNMIVMTIQVFITLTIMKNVFHIGINMSFWVGSVCDVTILIDCCGNLVSDCFFFKQPQCRGCFAKFNYHADGYAFRLLLAGGSDAEIITKNRKFPAAALDIGYLNKAAGRKLV